MIPVRFAAMNFRRKLVDSGLDKTCVCVVDE